MGKLREVRHFTHGHIANEDIADVGPDLRTDDPLCTKILQ